MPKPGRPIIVDARCIQPVISGIGRHALGLLKGIKDISPDLPIRVLINTPDLLPAELTNTDAFDLVTGLPGTTSPRNVWALPRQLRRMNASVYHALNSTVPRASGAATAITIYDLIPIQCRHLLLNSKKAKYAWLWKAWLSRQARLADAVMTISEYSAKDICQVLGTPREKIHVVYPGIEPVATPSECVVAGSLKSMSVKVPFFLYVGRRDPYKNIVTLVQAVAQIRELGIGPVQLVIVGQLDARYQEVEADAARLGLEEDVLITGHVSDVDLASLYAEATAFVFPSLYEGFGMPPLEAMSYGTPVIASNRTAIPEAVGDAAAIVEPDCASIAAAMVRALRDSAYRAELADRGARHVTQFTLQRQATETLEMYDRIRRGI